MKTISRRDFLKLGGLSLASLAFTNFLPEFSNFDDVELVRVAKDPVSVYKKPSDKSEIIATWPRDTLIHVYDTVIADAPGANPHWYRVFGGYMNASRLQKVRIQYNTPLSSIPSTKLLAEFTVPFNKGYRYNKWDGWFQDPMLPLYYSSIQWITDVTSGPDGKPWYDIQDEADKNLHYFVPAVQLRPIPLEDLTPISPEVENKWIDVNLTTQTLTCHENDQVVLSVPVSTGVRGLFDTPTGEFHILVKLPSRNMSTTSRFADDVIPLVGVPWTSFFTSEGHALHGTYWHDNFGVSMSHGCVNMRNEDALYLFRWTTPKAAFANINKETLDAKGYGTFVRVHG